MRIDTFLTPTAKSKSSSPSSDISADKFDMNIPGTSKGIVVLSPSPQSNLSFGFDISKPGPSGIAQLETSNSASFLFDPGKDDSVTMPRTESNQSFTSSNDSNSFEKPSSGTFPPLPALDDFISTEPMEQDQSGKTDSQRSVSEPFTSQVRSSSAHSHSSTMSAPCSATRSGSTSKETKENVSQERSRPQKKGGAFQKYTSSLKEQDKQSERERSDSLSSVDSISHELSHFRPIQSSPRTARKKLADGSRESPPIIQATPRNLKDMKTPVGMESPFVDPPPLVRAKLEQLNEERNMQVEATSKGTMTSEKVQHWKKIARPEARKTGTVSASTKRKLSKFEFSADGDGFMQPAKLQKVNPGAESRERRTVGTQKAIPVKKRQVQIDVDKESGVDDASCQLQRTSVPCAGSDKQPKNVDLKKGPVPKTVQRNEVRNSGAKRKVLMDDFIRKRPKESSTTCSDNTSKVAGQGEVSEQSSLESDAVSPSSSCSDTSPSKVYKMKLKVSKQGKVGSKVTPVKSVRNSDAKTPNTDVAKRKRTPVKQKPSTPSLSQTRMEVVNASGDAKNSSSGEPDLNQSPENYRKGLRSQQLRNGTSPGKGILVETIQNGSKKDEETVTAKNKQVCNLKELRTSPALNHTLVARTKSESPKVKRSPRSRKKPTVGSPKVTASSHTSKSPLSPPPPLKSLKGSGSGGSGGMMKSPRTERRNTLWKYMELLSDEEKRLKQEEEDRRIALELQKEFDKQEKMNRNKVIRSKGSKDAYRLRHSSSSSVP